MGGPQVGCQPKRSSGDADSAHEVRVARIRAEQGDARLDHEPWKAGGALRERLLEACEGRILPAQQSLDAGQVVSVDALLLGALAQLLENPPAFPAFPRQGIEACERDQTEGMISGHGECLAQL